jgi:hypothetical protein
MNDSLCPALVIGGARNLPDLGTQSQGVPKVNDASQSTWMRGIRLSSSTRETSGLLRILRMHVEDAINRIYSYRRLRHVVAR